MVDPTKPGPGQRLDTRFGIIMPWYTHGALDDILTMDLEGKTVFEWGGGCSTLWWSHAVGPKGCIYVTEAHQDWADWIRQQAAERGLTNVHVRRCWPDPLREYLRTPPQMCLNPHIDIIIVDGSERTACLKEALTLPKPLVIIVDNWQQDGVYIDDEAVEMMKPYEGKFYVQADHTDHQGRPWQTAIWRLT